MWHLRAAGKHHHKTGMNPPASPQSPEPGAELKIFWIKNIVFFYVM